MSDQISTKTPSEINALIVRSHVYRFIAACFRRPDSNEKVFEKESSNLPWDQIAEALPFPDKLQLAEQLRELSDKLHRTTDKDRIIEYEDCFGYTANGPVPCYELEYGEEHTRREPQQLSDIASFYHAFGLKINENNGERVDHIAVECEFMHYLLFKEAYALSSGEIENAEVCRQASARFLQEHLGRWAPSFALRLSRYAKQGFLRGLADFTFLFVVQDCEWLGMTAGPEDLPLRLVQEKEDSGCMSCSLRPATPQ